MFEEDVPLFVYGFMTVQSVKDLGRREFELRNFVMSPNVGTTTVLYIEKKTESAFGFRNVSSSLQPPTIATEPMKERT